MQQCTMIQSVSSAGADLEKKKKTRFYLAQVETTDPFLKHHQKTVIAVMILIVSVRIFYREINSGL